MATAHQYVITPEAVSTAGLVTYWRLTGSIALDKLVTAWTAAGLNVDELPKPPGPEVALGRAVRDQAGKNRLVRRLKNGTWLVVDETPASDSSTATYQVLASVKLENGRPKATIGDSTVQDIIYQTLYIGVCNAIDKAFNEHQGQLESDDISSWLVRIAGKLNAVSLRDTGGIYFVPRSNTDLWMKIINAVRSVSSHQVFSIPAMKNADAIAAITAAITEEVGQTVARVYQELEQDGDAKMGKRALKTRTDSMLALLAKVEEYEALVDSRLSARQQVEELQAALSTAALSVEIEG